MEHGLLYCSKKIVVFSRNQVGTSYFEQYSSRSSTCHICLRTIPPRTHHTHACMCGGVPHTDEIRYPPGYVRTRIYTYGEFITGAFHLTSKGVVQKRNKHSETPPSRRGGTKTTSSKTLDAVAGVVVVVGIGPECEYYCTSVVLTVMRPRLRQWGRSCCRCCCCCCR